MVKKRLSGMVKKQLSGAAKGQAWLIDRPEMAGGEASRARESCDVSNQVRSPSALVPGPRCRVPSLASSRKAPRRARATQQEPATGDKRHDPKHEFCPRFCRVSG